MNGVCWNLFILNYFQRSLSVQEISALRTKKSEFVKFRFFFSTVEREILSKVIFPTEKFNAFFALIFTQENFPGSLDCPHFLPCWVFMTYWQGTVSSSAAEAVKTPITKSLSQHYANVEDLLSTLTDCPGIKPFALLQSIPRQVCGWRGKLVLYKSSDSRHLLCSYHYLPTFRQGCYRLLYFNYSRTSIKRPPSGIGFVAT